MTKSTVSSVQKNADKFLIVLFTKIIPNFFKWIGKNCHELSDYLIQFYEIKNGKVQPHPRKAILFLITVFVILILFTITAIIIKFMSGE